MFSQTNFPQLNIHGDCKNRPTPKVEDRMKVKQAMLVSLGAMIWATVKTPVDHFNRECSCMSGNTLTETRPILSLKKNGCPLLLSKAQTAAHVVNMGSYWFPLDSYGFILVSTAEERRWPDGSQLAPGVATSVRHPWRWQWNSLLL